MDLKPLREQFETEGEQYVDVINSLSKRFGEIVSRDVISDVVEYCKGDLSTSTTAILSIVGDENAQPEAPQIHSELTDSNQINTNHLDMNHSNLDPTAVLIPQTNMSYSSMARATGAISRPTTEQQKSPKNNAQLTPQIVDIINRHKNGFRILILMRGVPGSGKTHLARKIIDDTVGASESNYDDHIASTDDFFYVRGSYNYDRSKIPDAHEWNQQRVNIMLRRGISPVIVDNTNIKIWEMQPYVKTGIEEGYSIEVIEPTTPWAGNAAKCFQMCQHNVPIQNIRRMLDKYEYFQITGERIINVFGLSHKLPLKRKYPPFEETSIPSPPSIAPSCTEKILADHDHYGMGVTDENQLFSQNIPSQTVAKVSAVTKLQIKLERNNSDTELIKNMDEKLIEIEKQLEEYDEIDRAWETNENWTEGDMPIKKIPDISEPKPPRQVTNAFADQPSSSGLNELKSTKSHFILTNKEEQDWRSCTQYLPPWNNKVPSTSIESPKIPVETRTSTTCVEIGDTDIPSKRLYNIVTGTPRDINFYYMPLEEHIPDKRMLDKSSMTDENITATCPCNNNKIFKAFCKMFKNIAIEDLRDIYDKCHGDVDWAADIVLGGVSSQTFETRNETVESDDEDPGQACACSVASGVIPDTKDNVKVDTVEFDSPQLLLPKKVKKDKAVSQNALQIKRQIEKNVVVSENHYSPHMLKIKHFRHGEPVPSTSSQNVAVDALPDNWEEHEEDQSDDGSINDNDFYEEETVNVNLGFDFIKKLDALFDRDGLNYSENIAPSISMPLSTLREINALWMESLTNQLDGQAAYAQVMMKEDEDIAKELAEQEEELERRGEQPAIPDLREIMDMEYAMSVYRKDVIGSKINEPPTLAEILSRNKLFAMFPDINQASLAEMLMAHDNNFKNTVEVVLMSLGRTDVLAAEAGIDKFIAQKEIEQHFERLEVEKQKQFDKEADFPMLNELNKEKNVTLDTVKEWREKANQLIENRTDNYRKAQEYMSRGMTSAATYYSSLANMQTKRCQIINNMAATLLIEYHKKQHDDVTLDLHHLRVVEALQTLDMFIDYHLKKLRDDQKKGIYKRVTLYIITGRGQHSVGGPKIRPATRRRLVKRGLRVVMLNAGVCGINLCCDDKMTHEL